MPPPHPLEAAPDERRKENERRFHNQRWGANGDVRQSLDRWYGAVSGCARAQHGLVARHGRGGRVLEYGCADARLSLGADHFIDAMEQFHGIDISDQAIEAARRSAAALGRSNCVFAVMDAERMTFPDEAFDVVFGSGILHHLDLSRSYAEIARVLRPGGKAIFIEPLGHNPLLNLFRKATPGLRTSDEHPLLIGDLELAKDHFRSVDLEHFGMTTLLAAPFQKPNEDSALMRLCERVDAFVLRIPFIRLNSWYVLMVMTK